MASLLDVRATFVLDGGIAIKKIKNPCDQATSYSTILAAGRNTKQKCNTHLDTQVQLRNNLTFRTPDVLLVGWLSDTWLSS